MEPLLTITYFPFFFSFLHPYQKSTVVQVPSDQTFLRPRALSAIKFDQAAVIFIPCRICSSPPPPSPIAPEAPEPLLKVTEALRLAGGRLISFC
ncbi:hypothetical protein I312_106210 [Cryptococcus bacillisporus CA1280]|uniref:uncharacterized protein n=1 Tax=Cryptococcus bacillisporus CA1280 TaxID=1296109 RepID=UPI0033677010